jgi:hypothetical protein
LGLNFVHTLKNEPNNICKEKMTTLQDVLLEQQDSEGRALGYLGDHAQRYSPQDMMITHVQDRVLRGDPRYLQALMQETSFGKFLQEITSINLQDPEKFLSSVREIAEKNGCVVKKEGDQIIVSDPSGIFSELRLPLPPEIKREPIGNDEKRNPIYTSPNPAIILGQWRNAIAASYVDCYRRNVNNPNLVLTLASRQMIEKALNNTNNPLQGLIVTDLRSQGGGRAGYGEGLRASGYLGNQGWDRGYNLRERAYDHQREMTELRFDHQREMLELRQNHQRELRQEEFERRRVLNYDNLDNYAERKRIDALYRATVGINDTYRRIWERASLEAIRQFNNRRRSWEQNAAASVSVLGVAYLAGEVLGPVVTRRAGQTPRVLAREGFGDPWIVRYERAKAA